MVAILSLFVFGWKETVPAWSFGDEDVEDAEETTAIVDESACEQQQQQQQKREWRRILNPLSILGVFFENR